jgi:protein HOOK3
MCCFHRKLSKRRLERQVKKLQEEKSAGGGQKVVVLQHLLDDANRLKAKFEKNYLEVSQERDILQSDMARIREGIPDALVDQSTHTLSLRLRVNDLEKEIKSLNQTITQLEKRITDGRFSEEDDDIRNKYSEMESKSKDLEEQTKRQLQDINKLLLEKDALQGQSIEQKDLLLEKEKLHSEMKASLAAIEAKDSEALTLQFTKLQAEHLALQEKHSSIKVKLKNSQNVCFFLWLFFTYTSFSLFSNKIRCIRSCKNNRQVTFWSRR